MVIMQAISLSYAVVSKFGETEYLGLRSPAKVYGDQHDLQRRPKSKDMCRRYLIETRTERQAPKSTIARAGNNGGVSQV